MQILEHDLPPTIVELVKQRAAAMAKNLLNDMDLRVYVFEGKKNFCCRKMLPREIARSKHNRAAIYTAESGIMNTPTALNKISQYIAQIDPYVIQNYADELLNNLL